MSLSFGYRSESDPVMESTTSNLPIIANTVVDPAAICKNELRMWILFFSKCVMLQGRKKGLFCFFYSDDCAKADMSPC